MIGLESTADSTFNLSSGKSRSARRSREDEPKTECRLNKGIIYLETNKSSV